MHPTDHYTALGWTLRDVSNYIVVLVWFEKNWVAELHGKSEISGQ